jgi:hypothetical protein
MKPTDSHSVNTKIISKQKLTAPEQAAHMVKSPALSEYLSQNVAPISNVQADVVDSKLHSPTPESSTIMSSLNITTSKTNKSSEKIKPKKLDAQKSVVKPRTDSTKKTGNVVSISQTAVREMFEPLIAKPSTIVGSATRNALDTENGSQKADVAALIWNESFAISQQQLETCGEVSAIAAEATSRLSENMMNYANDALVETVEMSKRLFACRTASDLFTLQQHMSQKTMKRFFNESAKSTDLIFTAASKASEPLAETINGITSCVNKALKKQY